MLLFFYFNNYKKTVYRQKTKQKFFTRLFLRVTILKENS